MNRFLISKKMYIISYLFFVVSVVVSAIIFLDIDRPNYYKYLWVLPMLHAIGVIIISYLFSGAWENQNFLLVVFVFSIRNVVTPFFMRFGDYKGMFNMLTQANVNRAIVLMLIETLFMILFTAYESQYSNNKEKKDIKIIESRLSDILVVSFIIIAVGIFFVRRDFYSGFRTIFQTRELRTSETVESALGSWFTIFSVFFPVCYLFCALYLINLVNKMGKSILRTVLNVLIIGIPLLFMNNSDGFTLICVISLGLTTVRVGGISKKQFYFGICVLVCCVVLILFYLMNGEIQVSLRETLSRYMQAYFPGVCNFAGFFNINEADKLKNLGYDIYYTIPFRNTLIGISGDYRLVMQYTEDNNARSQILPCFIQLYYYFGLLAPLIECLYIKFAFVNYDGAKRKENVYSYFTNVIVWIYLVLTPVMYNYTIFMSRFLTTFVILIVLSRLICRNVSFNVKAIEEL